MAVPKLILLLAVHEINGATTGNQLGAADDRNRGFWHVLDVLNGLEHKPTYLLLENVKGFEVRSTGGGMQRSQLRANHTCHS